MCAFMLHKSQPTRTSLKKREKGPHETGRERGGEGGGGQHFMILSQYFVSSLRKITRLLLISN